MIAWVLLIQLGSNASTAVPGIESERECKLLADRVAQEWTIGRPATLCLSYRGAYRF